MESTVQLNFNLATTEQLNKAWAFAVIPHRRAAKSARARIVRSRRRLRKADIQRSIITACSKQAKALGIKAGMPYEEAKLRVPSIKILVIGGEKS